MTSPLPEDIAGNLEAAKQEKLARALQNLEDLCDVAERHGDARLGTLSVRMSLRKVREALQ